MKTTILMMTLSMFIISCGSNDLQSRLRELESQRDALNAEIDKIKQEIVQENGGKNHEKVTYVKIAQLNPVNFKHYIKVQGTIESDNNILVPPKSSGIVKSVHVKKGDWVQKGQLLAELDGAIYESSIAELKTNLELANTVFERQQRLWNKKIGSEIQYLQAKTTKESLEQKLKTVNEQYKLTKITAPINGTVDEILIKEGEAAAAGFGAIRIVQLSELKIQAALSENYITHIKKGDTVKVEIPVSGKTFNLTLDAVSQVIDPKNRTFNIEIKIPKNEMDIKPNMLAVLTINDYSNTTALVVPIDIVQKTGSKKFLFSASDFPESEKNQWKVDTRFVETGMYYDNQVEIVNGLNAGEKIVIFGFQDLADGQIVQVNGN